MRFASWDDEWQLTKLESACTFLKGSVLSKANISEKGQPCILYGQLYTTYFSEEITEVFSNTTHIDNRIERSEKGDVIIPCSGETPEDIATARCVMLPNVLYGGDLNVLRTKEHNGTFLSFQLNGKRRMEIAKIAVGKTIVHLHASDLKKLKIWLPQSTKEEEKIASFLSTINKRIMVQNKIIEEYSFLRKRIADSLIAMLPERFEKVLLKSVLTERNEKNDNSYPVYSVAVEAGVVNQIEHLGRSFAAYETNHYHVVHRGDLIYTKSPTGSFPCGIIKQSNINKIVAVSPLYGVYVPCRIEIGHFLHYYFLNETNANNYLRPLVDKGAKNTMNITNRRFLEGNAWVPKREFSLSISNLLSTIESNYQAAKKLKELYNAQKTFFLQNLFI